MNSVRGANCLLSPISPKNIFVNLSERTNYINAVKYSSEIESFEDAKNLFKDQWPEKICSCKEAICNYEQKFLQANQIYSS